MNSTCINFNKTITGIDCKSVLIKTIFIRPAQVSKGKTSEKRENCRKIEKMEDTSNRFYNQTIPLMWLCGSRNIEITTNRTWIVRRPGRPATTKPRKHFREKNICSWN